ncbi:MAG TPA: PAS domain-containing protein [Burkholderiales bacterium]|nr:PAS domain-containing protein [Burkholderiales bacterium]
MDTLSRLLADSAMARAALGACPSPIAILDAAAPARPVTYVNAAFEAFFDIASREALGKPLGALVFRGDEALIHRMLAETVQKKTVKAWSKDGTLRHVEVALGPTRDREGRVTHWTVAFTDRSEVERLRGELDSMRSLDAKAA